MRLKKPLRVLIISDTHIPYHDKTGWKLVLLVLGLGWDIVVINGDFADCAGVSFHTRNLARKQGLAHEIKTLNECLDQLQAASGSARVVYIGGNHEFRLDRYIAEKAPELYGLDGTTIPDLLGLGRRGIEWIPYKAAAFKVGKLSVVHDIGRAGINTARQSLLDFGGNLVVGHSHRAGIAYQGNVQGEAHCCVNGGWLGDVGAIDYIQVDKAKRDWQLGFTSAYIDRHGNAHLTFHPVIKGSVFVRDRYIEVKP